MLKKKSDDEKIALALTAELTIPAIKFTIIQSTPGLYNYNTIANLIVYLIMLFFLIPIIRIVFRRNSIAAIFSLLLISILILSNIIFFPENRENILSHSLRIYTVSYVCFLLSLSLYDFKPLLNYLYNASYLIIIFSLYMLASTSVLGAVGAAATEYNMSLSYYCLIPTIIMLLKFFESKRPFSLLFFILGLIVILGMGSRGPLIGILTFIILYKLKSINSLKKLLIDIVLYSVPLMILIFYSKEIVQWLYSYFQSINIESRTLYYLLMGEISAKSNRDIIGVEILNKIKDNSIFGIGFLGDISSHNIILETLLFFGVIFGTLLLAILAILVVKALTFTKNRDLVLLIIVFFSYAIPDALLNLTVWGKDMFWIFIGFCITSSIYTLKQRSQSKPGVLLK